MALDGSLMWPLTVILVAPALAEKELVTVKPRRSFLGLWSWMHHWTRMELTQKAQRFGGL